MPVDMMEKYIIAKDGLPYVLKIDDEFERIGIFHEDEEIGYFEFSIETDDVKNVSYWMLMYMTISRTHIGLGEEVLHFHRECTKGEPIFSRYGSHQEHQDASQLTGLGIPFVAKMIKKGLIQK